MSENSKRVVNRYFVAILYEEDENFKYYFDYIIKNYEEVTYIRHNRDVDEDGETKKEHIHILFKVGDNARHLTKVAREIGILPNYLQGCNKDAYLLYMIHYKNPEKTQYKIEEVKGELQNRLKILINKAKPEEQRYLPIITAIQNGKIKDITQLICYGIGSGCIDDIKRCQYLLCKCIEEKWKKKDDDKE